MPRDQTAVAIEKQTEVLKDIAEGIAEANELARAQLEKARDSKPETSDPKTEDVKG